MRNKPVVAAIAAIIVFALLSVVVYAGDTSHDPKIVSRIEKQQQRIDQGIKKGQLTKQEVDLVQGNLDKIKAQEAKLKAESKLTDKAKADLNRKLDMNSRMIDKEKNNVIRQID